MRQCYSPTRMAKMQMPDNIKCCQGHGGTAALTAAGTSTGAIAVEN